MFTLRGIPVHVSPFFFLLVAFIAFRWQAPIVEVILYAGVFAISILVHELGHAMMARRYRLGPLVVIHGVGGYCAHQPADTDRHEALIVVAGPLAGILLGVFTALVHGALAMAGVALGPLAMSVIMTSYFINFGWSVVNLLPMWPLDGGRLFRLAVIQVLPIRWVDRVTHGVGAALLLGGALLAFNADWTIAGFIALFMLYQNVRVLMGEASGGSIRSRNRRAGPMLEEVKAAYAAEDFEEALRLAHVLRAESNLSAKVVSETSAIVGVCTARLGRHGEALPYLKRSPARADVVEAMVECLHMLDRQRELDELLSSAAFRKLPKARREEIVSVVPSFSVTAHARLPRASIRDARCKRVAFATPPR